MEKGSSPAKKLDPFDHVHLKGGASSSVHVMERQCV